MRTLLLTLLLAVAAAGSTVAQLRFLGTDPLPKRTNPYESPELSGGLVALGQDFYFSTPSGKLYRTDGTEAGTQVVYTLDGQFMPVLAATNRFLYVFLEDPARPSYVHRYTPGSRTLEEIHQENPAQSFRFNRTRVPGYSVMADLMAVSPDRKNIVFRNFIDDAMWLNLISDDAPEKVQTIKYCSPGEFASGEYSIFPLSGIAFVRDEIFVNGYEHDLLTAASRPDVAGKPQLTRTGNREFTATSLQKKPGDATPGIWAAITIWEVKGIHFTKACCKPSQTCLHW